eukprot:10352496-Alexandrium_andersonii.AAC.1
MVTLSWLVPFKVHVMRPVSRHVVAGLVAMLLGPRAAPLATLALRTMKCSLAGFSEHIADRPGNSPM